MGAVRALGADLLVIEERGDGYDIARRGVEERAERRVAHRLVVEARGENELVVAAAERGRYDVVEHQIAARDHLARDAEALREQRRELLRAVDRETEDRREVLLL